MERMTDTVFPLRSSKAEVEEGNVFQPKFDDDGLIPAIVLDIENGDVVMFAWMNAAALKMTLETQVAHFWSRSRAKIWKKGEESGNTLQIAAVRTDCDQDAILLDVTISGAGLACHTNRHSCFYRNVRSDQAGSSYYLDFRETSGKK